MACLERIPKVDKVLGWPEVTALLERHPRPVVVEAVRSVLDVLRGELSGDPGGNLPSRPELAARVEAALFRLTRPSLQRVVNGTGVVIHTNLGRSPLATDVRDLVEGVAFGYCNLEFDLDKGVRGDRCAHVESLLCELTGAEAALVVNNNAAAVLLALAALAAGKEVVVSRGELVEIGGSFRIPDVMRESGAVLREVGTTNRTHPADYEAAVTPETALFLKVHASNFAVVGFTAEVPAPGLVQLAAPFGVPVMADVGSGSIVDLSPFGLGREPTIREFVRAGVDVITFSGDKLIGGPQAGLIVGKRERLATMAKHPLMRALRCDKLTLAALEGTLRLYRDEREALARIPTLRMLTRTPEELGRLGGRIVRRLKGRLSPHVSVSLVRGASRAGGGALPEEDLPSVLLAVAVAGTSPQRVEGSLRSGPVPVIGRIVRGTVHIDLRTILDDDLPHLVAALAAL